MATPQPAPQQIVYVIPIRRHHLWEGVNLEVADPLTSVGTDLVGSSLPKPMFGSAQIKTKEKKRKQKKS